MIVDKIDSIDKTTFQHGKLNDRVYLMSIDSKYTSKVIKIIESLAQSNKYTKIIAKIPERSRTTFLSQDYAQEAHIPQMFHGIEDGYFVCKYFDESRSMDIEKSSNEEIIKKSVKNKKNKTSRNILDQVVVKLSSKDVGDMTKLYGSVFKTYPYPLYDPGYIANSMHDNMEYYGIKENGKLIALASTEIDIENSFAEFSDFAVVPEFRGRGLAQHILSSMENKLKERNISTYYTIARARSIGMNMIFANLGYNYGGTLVNNTAISGGIESMNVWYKNMM